MYVCVRVREKLPCRHDRAGFGSPLTAHPKGKIKPIDIVI